MINIEAIRKQTTQAQRLFEIERRASIKDQSHEIYDIDLCIKTTESVVEENAGRGLNHALLRNSDGSILYFKAKAKYPVLSFLRDSKPYPEDAPVDVCDIIRRFEELGFEIDYSLISINKSNSISTFAVTLRW